MGTDEITRITKNASGYAITTGYGITLTRDATRRDALTALYHRGFTPQVAVASLNIAAQNGTVTVAGLTAD